MCNVCVLFNLYAFFCPMNCKMNFSANSQYSCIILHLLLPDATALFSANCVCLHLIQNINLLFAHVKGGSMLDSLKRHVFVFGPPVQTFKKKENVFLRW